MLPQISEQAGFFLLVVFWGVSIGIVYDIFRIIRKTFKHPNFLTQLEDIAFWALVSFGTFYFILSKNNGEIRPYLILGIFLGVLLYFLSISKFFINVSMKFLSFLKKVLLTLFTIISMPFKVVFNIFKIPFRFLRNKYINVKKPVKKFLQNTNKYAKIKKGNLSNNLKIIFKKV